MLFRSAEDDPLANIATAPLNIRRDAGDYGGNFASYTPPPGAEGRMVIAEDTNATTPGRRIYVYSSGAWRYSSLARKVGTATIAANTTSVIVAHGLGATPRAAKHCPRDNLGAVWVSARDGTNITLNVATAPTADTITDWEAEL